MHILISALSLFFMLTTPSQAVRIYQTANMGEAHLRVALTDNLGDADAAIYRAGSWGMAQGPYQIFITRNKADAEMYWYFTSRGMAQCVIKFVDRASEAGALTPRAKRCFR